MIQRLAVIVFALTAFAARIHAHTVWIEPANGQLVVRFAEPGNDLETSPGYLDNLSAPQAFTVITNKPVTIEAPKKSDHFSLMNVTPTSIAAVETIFTVRGGRKPHFYARWQPAGAGTGQPLLTFDIVPTGKPGEARVWLRGQPLGGVKAFLRTPDETEEELTADSEGFVRFKAEKPGQYLLTVPHHREPLAGFHLGVAYKETSHNAALMWHQP